MEKIGFYAGSFDPLTVGHFAIICEALASHDKLIIGVGHNAAKKGLFTPEERCNLIHASVRDFLEAYEYKNVNQREFSEAEVNAIERLKKDPNIISTVAYDDLTIDCAIRNKATTLVRGQRFTGDSEEESHMAMLNKELLGIRGVHLGTQLITTPKEELTYISSSDFRMLCGLGEYIAASKYVSKKVHHEAMKKYLWNDFAKASKDIGIPEAKAEIAYKKVCTAYSEGRFHHDMSHVAHCLNYIRIYRALNGGIKDYSILTLGLFFHDFVNKGEANDEERSADHLIEFLNGTAPDVQSKGRKIVLATKHIGGKDAKLQTLEEQLASDVDVAILGDKRNYHTYAQGIRQEYIRLSEKEYSQGRAIVLKGLMAEDTLFKTEYFKKLCKKNASRNMEKEIGIWLSCNDNYRDNGPHRGRQEHSHK